MVRGEVKIGANNCIFIRGFYRTKSCLIWSPQHGIYCKNYTGATNVCIPMRDICPFFLFEVEFAACHSWSLALDTRDLPSVVIYLFWHSSCPEWNGVEHASTFFCSVQTWLCFSDHRPIKLWHYGHASQLSIFMKDVSSWKFKSLDNCWLNFGDQKIV